jgi:hypothetical protein
VQVAGEVVASHVTDPVVAVGETIQVATVVTSTVVPLEVALA